MVVTNYLLTGMILQVLNQSHQIPNRPTTGEFPEVERYGWMVQKSASQPTSVWMVGKPSTSQENAETGNRKPYLMGAMGRTVCLPHMLQGQFWWDQCSLTYITCSGMCVSVYIRTSAMLVCLRVYIYIYQYVYQDFFQLTVSWCSITFASMPTLIGSHQYSSPQDHPPQIT